MGVARQRKVDPWPGSSERCSPGLRGLLPELGVNFPSSGGEHVYLTRAYGPAWGFMTGWLLAGFSAPVAAAALIFAHYVGYFFRQLIHRAP
jgi:amino acid transporter